MLPPPSKPLKNVATQATITRNYTKNPKLNQEINEIYYNLPTTINAISSNNSSSHQSEYNFSSHNEATAASDVSVSGVEDHGGDDVGGRSGSVNTDGGGITGINIDPVDDYDDGKDSLTSSVIDCDSLMLHDHHHLRTSENSFLSQIYGDNERVLVDVGGEEFKVDYTSLNGETKFFIATRCMYII